MAIEVPTSVLVAVLSVSFPAVVMLMAWMVRELGRVSTSNGRMEERLDAGEQRMNDMALRLHDLERSR